jgi:hypothetical protein
VHILRHVDTLLGNDIEIYYHTRATQIDRNQQVHCNRRMVLSVQSVPKCKQDNLMNTVSGMKLVSQ